MKMTSSLRRMLMRTAKKGINKCHLRIAKLFRKEYMVLEDAMMECIFTKLDEKRRLSITSTSSRSANGSFVIPLLLIRSDSCGNFEVHTDHMDLLIGHALYGCCGYKQEDGVLTFTQRHFETIVSKLVSNIDGVEQLWLDTTCNGKIAQMIVDQWSARENLGCRNRFVLEQLTVIGAIGQHEMDSLSCLILLSRRTINSLRFRHCRVHTPEQAARLWAAVSQCHSLTQLQYEPCKMDRWSRLHVVDALEKKKLNSFIMTGVLGLSPEDLFKTISSSSLTELAVVGDKLPASLYARTQARKHIKTLSNLLIQIDANYSLDSCDERKDLLAALSNLPESAVLEVIHINPGGVLDTAKAICYWLQLSRDSNRTIKLKLEECSQERQDSAVGRLLRKCADVSKVAFNPHGISLTLDDTGKLVVFDKNTWFGDDE